MAPSLSPTLVPASHASKEAFGTVLVLDTSYSMAGEPLAAAVAAEQTFASHRNPNEQLGAINFWRRLEGRAPAHDRPDEDLREALHGSPVHGGTHIYDAVAQAEAMLEAAHIGSGSIVVLSDGADRNSAKTLRQVGQAARAAHIRIYTVGLTGPTFRPGTLELSRQPGTASTRRRSPRKTSTRSSTRSASRSQRVPAPVQVAGRPGQARPRQGGRERGRHRFHAVPDTRAHGQTTAPPPYKPSIGDRILGSPITMILLALLCAAVIAFLVIAILQPRRSGLPARMAEFVSIRGLQRDKGQTETAAATEEGAAERETWWTRFEETLEIADIKGHPRRSSPAHSPRRR